MFLRLFLLFTLLPIAELWLLIRIGGWLGVGPTLLLVLGTGAAGAWLAKREGLRAWLAVQSEIAAGRPPTDGLTHAMLILLAGVVLITPGVITDVAGLLLLLPPVRTGLIARLRDGFMRRVERGSITVVGTPGGPFGFGATGFQDPTRDNPQSREGSQFRMRAHPGDPEPPSGREIVIEPEAASDR